ncbi:TrkH family potassium uptake protein [Halobacillus naozhouensis]|uniref:TrkH family potassium uptake protein n=1 Tax=Halobacillus naozhouensis TaxID=554880 RepID=A0ABY8J483_9BACI|nr:TrkH family potassium uptake protein [Halobacillus naozhouensis]WFT76876.1 TrkH family potassium uptake protein [Halobacillus naozhouensis]
MRVIKQQVKNVQLNPPLFIAFGFLFLILLGGLLLKLPIATTMPVSWIDALFTSASAVTVTGLWVVDTGTAYTLFGEVVILALIQIGGLGFMTFSILIFMIFGKKIGLKQRILIQEQLQTSLGGIIRLVKRLVIFALTIESVGVILLSVRWVPEMGLWKGIYYSLFHIVSSFNNAGFALWPDSLSDYVGDPVVNIVITLMFVLGGLGFTVINDLGSKKTFRLLTLHTKLMVIGTITVNMVAIVTFYLLEINNPETLGKLSDSEQLWAAYFQGISPRTAGFNTVPIGELEDPTLMFVAMLMFIGAGSVSTAGGIKLTTFIIILFAVGTYLKHKSQSPVLFNRNIKVGVVYRAQAIVVTSLSFIFLALFTLTITENKPFIDLLFEVMSAFGTVGLSTGITTSLSTIGKMIIMCMMYVGLVGPLSVVLSLARREEQKIRHPEEDVLTG